jgi:hypothetical protein
MYGTSGLHSNWLVNNSHEHHISSMMKNMSRLGPLVPSKRDATLRDGDDRRTTLRTKLFYTQGREGWNRKGDMYSAAKQKDNMTGGTHQLEGARE